MVSIAKQYRSYRKAVVPSKQILIIDDEADNRMVIGCCLEDLGGWQVLEAASGEEGLLEVQTRKPDAIILDIEMGGMNGIEFLQRLRANPEHQKIPVVLLTVIADLLDPQELSKLGVVKILAKPFKLSALITQIAEVLE
ncbi:hypothetical protein NIES593_04935 [Hydrococcus rivularis NIES-593]|uniref:Response regulatory domain-containing protein n=1 Tax=Hydrococcus rivularis NIES-593 TaxID=1921803 RepID=A0A1U7HQ22_9CYAN|nr:hypothetical protein NIES593_04935 [Hydrococcus rivularis NIES-593]